MDKDRADLIDIAITVVEQRFGSLTNVFYEDLFKILDLYFPLLRFTLDEIVEHYSLAIEVEDTNLILINTGNEG